MTILTPKPKESGLTDEEYYSDMLRHTQQNRVPAKYSNSPLLSYKLSDLYFSISTSLKNPAPKWAITKFIFGKSLKTVESKSGFPMARFDF